MARKGKLNNSKLLIIAITLIGLSVIAGLYTYNLTLSVLSPGAQTTGEGNLTLKVVWLNGTDISNTTNVTIFTCNSSKDVMNISYWDELTSKVASNINISIEENTTYIALVNLTDFNITHYEVLDAGINTIRLIPKLNTSEDLYYTLSLKTLESQSNITGITYGININDTVKGQKGLAYRGYPYNDSLPEDYSNIDYLKLTFDFYGNISEDLINSGNLTIDSNLQNVVEYVNETRVIVHILADVVDQCYVNLEYDIDFIEARGGTQMLPLPIKMTAEYQNEVFAEISIA